MLSRFAAAIAIATVIPAAGHAVDSRSGSPLRALADSNGAHRWELQWESLSLYDAATSRLIRRFPLEGAAQSSARGMCPPDIVEGAAGAVYVTSNIQPVLWRVHPGAARAEKLDLAIDQDHSRDFGFTGLSISADGSTLYGVSSTDGAAWRLEPRAAKAYKVGTAVSVDRDCGR